jgi:inner membrane protein
MTSRTHDLGAFTALTITFSIFPVPATTVATLLVVFFANMLGGLFPDLDETTSTFWKKFRAGSVISVMIKPLLGGHRLISHSLVGLIITGFLLDKLLRLINPFLLVDMSFVWSAFMLGVVSHLVLDSLTKEGVPWLFPLPWKVGFPPVKALRVKTGSMMEKSLVFPGLLVLNGYVIYHNYPKIVAYFGTLL